jgi:hypothetical protein
MKLVLVMTVVCVAAAAAAVAIAASAGTTGITGAVFGGMIGPLVAAAVSWLVVERTHRRNPAAVHGVMMGAFGIKAFFFGLYAVAMIKVFGLDVQTFAISFACFFIALYAIEAALFSRLFRRPASESR